MGLLGLSFQRQGILSDQVDEGSLLEAPLGWIVEGAGGSDDGVAFTETDTAETATVTLTTTIRLTMTAGPSSPSPAIEKRFNDSIRESLASEDSFHAEDFALDRHNDDDHYDSRRDDLHRLGEFENDAGVGDT